MAAIGGQQKSEGFDRFIFDEGFYDMKLVKVMGLMGKPNQFHPEGQPKLMMVWRWVDENGTEYQNESDQPYELVELMGMPKNFAYNEKTAYWKRLSEIAGFAINNETIGATAHDFGDFILSFADILEVIENADADKPDKKGNVTAVSVMVNGVEQLGKICKLVVKKTPSDKDPKVFYNNIGSVVQAQASQPKRPPAPKAAPAQPKAAPAAQAAPAQQARSAPRPTAPAVEPQFDEEGNELPY
jgi:hypothetical protein